MTVSWAALLSMTPPDDRLMADLTGVKVGTNYVIVKCQFLQLQQTSLFNIVQNNLDYFGLK